MSIFVLVCTAAVFIYKCIPNPVYEKFRYDAQGHALLTFTNEAFLTDVRAIRFVFIVTDRDALKRITQKHRYDFGNLVATSANPVDDVFFTEGSWRDDGY